jgi:hypothetical protein
MLAILHLFRTAVANPFKSRRRLEVENLFLRHQLNIALRGAPHRLQLRASDRALLVWMTRLWPGLLGLSRVVQPDTKVVDEHIATFRPAQGVEALSECRETSLGFCVLLGVTDKHSEPPRLLRTRSERPRCRRAAEERYELAAL